VVKITGINVWDTFRHEPGKHVIQRCPTNERSSRRHTSVVSVAVLPLPPENNKERLPEKEVEITTQRGHGKGGQHQNTTDSAVRVRHLPTGLTVFINGRDQSQNKKMALAYLTVKVNLAKDLEAEEKYGIERREQLGNGGRGSKVRTYNLIDNFVKDHRTGKSVHRPKEIFAGRFELLL
jgi:peptide chain release factor 1